MNDCEAEGTEERNYHSPYNDYIATSATVNTE